MQINPVSLLSGYPPPIIHRGLLRQGRSETHPFYASDLGVLMFHLAIASIPISGPEHRYSSYQTQQPPEWLNSLAFFIDWRPIQAFHFGYLWCGNTTQIQSTVPMGFSLLEISVEAKNNEEKNWIVKLNGVTDGWDLVAQEVRFYLFKNENLSRDLDALLSVFDLFSGDIGIVDVMYPTQCIDL